jgi:antirestriction protein ArdC
MPKRTSHRIRPQRIDAPRNEARANLYDEVTARIVTELEAGRFPWVQPWGAQPGGTGPSLPRNGITARPYSGVNILILWGAVIEHGWPSQSWLTFRQAQEAGGCVRKGEHGVTVVYADRFTPEAEKERADRDGDGEGEESSVRGTNDRRSRAVPFLKRYTVFNVTQCDGLRPGLAADPTPLAEREIVPVAEEVIAASGVDFRIGGERAFYAPDPDFVQVPPQPAFFDQINYYRTCLHEVTHATGHAKRLGRDLRNGFGSKDYAREELIAEMGSAFLCAALGIVPTVRHADYVGSWLEVLREDNRAIFRAASAATKAADWLLARHREAQETRIEGRIAA